MSCERRKSGWFVKKDKRVKSSYLVMENIKKRRKRKKKERKVLEFVGLFLVVLGTRLN